MNTKFFSPSRWKRFSLQTLFILLTILTTLRSARTAPYELWKINADGTGLARFADTPGFTCGSPEWSPDGKWIAYDTWRSDGETYQDSQIAIVRADGTGHRDFGSGAMPSWSPDGKQLVFHGYSRNNAGKDRITVVNTDGTGRETILDHWGSPRWCPRGNRIASIHDGNLALFDLAAGNERTILPGMYSVHLGFGISPDGNQFCFGGNNGGLYLATLDDGKPAATVRCLVDAGSYQFPSFSPDGKRIVFGDIPKGSVSQLYMMDVDKTNEHQLLPGQDASRDNWGPTWSPDGKTIVFCSKPVTVAAKKDSTKPKNTNPLSN